MTSFGARRLDFSNGRLFLWNATLFLALLPWLIIKIPQAINSDMAWLSEAAWRLLQGGHMARDFYETNPPLSILLYVPAVLAWKGLHVPLPYALFWQTSLILLSCAGLAFLLLKNIPGVDRLQAWLLTAVFILANTVLSSIYYGERDQILGMLLLPFVLAQLSITFGWPCGQKLRLAVLMPGALMILLKPHFGLLPVLLIVHRALHRRRPFTFLRDTDFICLGIACVAYFAAVEVFFHDYLTIILPDVVSLYLPETNNTVPPWSIFFIIVAGVFALIAEAFAPSKQAGALTAFLFGAALICIIPYWVQMRGFYYHLMPAFAFFYIGLACLIFSQLRRAVAAPGAAGLTFFAMTALLYAMSLPDPRIPNHVQYAALPVSQLVRDCGAPGCRFFMFNNSLEMIHQLAYYTGREHASRFPAYWFLPHLVREQAQLDAGLPATMTAAKIARLREKYARMTADDFQHYKPELVLIGRFHIVPDKLFNFVDYFSANPAFAQDWKNYHKTGTITVDMRSFYPGLVLTDKTKDDILVTYDIYRRMTS